MEDDAKGIRRKVDGGSSVAHWRGGGQGWLGERDRWEEAAVHAFDLERIAPRGFSIRFAMRARGFSQKACKWDGRSSHLSLEPSRWSRMEYVYMSRVCLYIHRLSCVH